MSQAGMEWNGGRSREAAKAAGGNSLLETLQSSVEAHQAGDLETARKGYRRALRMQPHNVDALQLLGVLTHQEGDSEGGIRLLGKALKRDPANVRCHTNLGSIYNELGRYKEAEKHFRAALKGDNVPAEAWYNIGQTQRRRGLFDEALDSFARALEADPEYLAPKKARGGIHVERHQFAEAETVFRDYLKSAPDDLEIANNLGYVVQMQGRLDEAEDLFRRAMDMAGRRPELGYNMRTVLAMQGRGEEARELFRRQLRENPETWTGELGLALGLAMRGAEEEALRNLDDILDAFPDNAGVWNDVGRVLMSLNKYPRAAEVLKRAIEIDPTLSSAHNNLGAVYIHTHNHAAAVGYLKKAVALDPAKIDPYLNLCRALRHTGEHDQANLFGRAAMDLESFDKRYFACLLQVFRGTCDYEALARLGSPWDCAKTVPTKELPATFLDFLVFSETHDDHQKFFDLVRQWAAFAEREAVHAPLPAKTRDGAREKLRIGWLSSDLRSHSVSRFLIPLMRSYDRDRFEFYCYSPVKAPGDTIQTLFESQVDRFTYVMHKTHREIARLIQDDDLDILIELNGFTNGAKLEVMTYKPAPVQMSWVGYPFTCGLEAIDHVVLNQYLDAPEGRRYLVEEPVNMPESWLCFGKFADVEIQPGLPMDRTGVFTFGTLNNIYKYTPGMIANWAKVLERVPGSRFLIVRPEADSVVVCKNIAAEFSRHGIGPERLYFFNNRREKRNHLSYYNEIDLSLDTFPLTGGTTTTEAVWMGVPVVSLVGDVFHQRLSYAVLMQAGLEDFCAFDAESFVERAVEMAGRPDHLRFLRHNLRDVVKASPLCDEDRFVFQFQEMLEAVADHHHLR